MAAQPTADGPAAERPSHAASEWPSMLDATAMGYSDVSVVFRPDLRLAPEPTIFFERHLVCADEEIARTPVWRHSFDASDHAERHYEWMLDSQAKWCF